MIQRLVHPLAIWLFALVVAGAGLAAGGCASSPVPPESPAAQEATEPWQAWNPVVAVEPGGRIFVTYYGGRGGSDYGLFFTRSLDGGATWLPEHVRLEASPQPTNRIGFHQLETNGAGKVLVSWSVERREGAYWHPKEVRYRQSSDSGTSWDGEPVAWPFETKSNYPTTIGGRDGEVHLLWTQNIVPVAVPLFIRTKQGGKAWTAAPVTLPGPAGAVWNPRGAPSSREAAWPALAIEPRGGLYAVWQESSTRGTDILFNRSQDGGVTWLDSSLRLNTPTPEGSYTSRMPVVALDEAGGIYVVWEDSRHNTSDLYFNRSLDGGGTWLDQDVWLTVVRPSMASASEPTLLTDRSGHLYLLWSDIREAPYSIYFTRSLDRGATWPIHPIRIDHHEPLAITWAPKLANDNEGHVYAAWWEGTEPTKGSVRFNRSDDYGATWLEREQILDKGLGKDGPRFPWLRVDEQGVVYVTWSSDRTGRYRLYLNRSTDHGKTWLPQDIQITGRPAGAGS